jgi:hypothetical protein
MTMDDSWDLDEPAPERAMPEPDLLEDVQAVLAALRAHPRVQWVERMNVGSFAVEHRDRLGQVRRGYVRCGFEGLSDVIGQLRGGLFLAVEAKRRKGGKVSPDQREFLARVAEAGGVAFIARSAADVVRNLGEG